jgi:hypothetical protein
MAHEHKGIAKTPVLEASMCKQGWRGWLQLYAQRVETRGEVRTQSPALAAGVKL